MTLYFCSGHGLFSKILNKYQKQQICTFPLHGSHNISATVVSLGKKLDSHYLSHPAVKPGHLYANMHRAQLKNSLRLMLSSLLK